MRCCEDVVQQGSFARPCAHVLCEEERQITEGHASRTTGGTISVQRGKQKEYIKTGRTMAYIEANRRTGRSAGRRRVYREADRWTGGTAGRRTACREAIREVSWRVSGASSRAQQTLDGNVSGLTKIARDDAHGYFLPLHFLVYRCTHMYTNTHVCENWDWIKEGDGGWAPC